MAEISDKLTRNEIASSNEIRQIIGWRPSSDPKADELRNSNLSAPNNIVPTGTEESVSAENDDSSDYDSIVNELLDSIEAEINSIIGNYVDDNDSEDTLDE